MKRVSQQSTGVTTALIYTRVSSDEQAREGVSLDAQLSECRRYAASKGWILGSEYTDVLSGTRDDRPQYQALLAEVRRLRSATHPVVVVVAALDRFGRRLLERVRAREELKALGVSTHSVREGGEVSDLVANILASVAQEEVRRLGERVAAAREHIRSTGWQPPGRTTLGYRRRLATSDERRHGAPKSVLEIDPERAAVARELFARVDRGISVRAVSRWLGSLPTDVRGGRSCGFMSVRRLLSSRTYIGQVEDGRHGNWEPLIDDDLFARVQARITGHQHMPRQASGKYLLTGLLRCPACNGRMSGGARGTRPSMYECRSEERGAAPTLSSCRYSASVAKLDGLVIAEIGDLLERVDSTDPTLRSALRRAWAALSQPIEDMTTLMRACEQAAGKARERIKRLALLFADGDIDREGYELGRAQAQADLEAAEAQRETLRPSESAVTLPSLDEVLTQVGGWRKVLADGDIPEKRDVLGALVARVLCERVGYGRFRVTLVWGDLGEHLRSVASEAAGDTRAA